MAISFPSSATLPSDHNSNIKVIQVQSPQHCHLLEDSATQQVFGKENLFKSIQNSYISNFPPKKNLAIQKNNQQQNSITTMFIWDPPPDAPRLCSSSRCVVLAAQQNEGLHSAVNSPAVRSNAETPGDFAQGLKKPFQNKDTELYLPILKTNTETIWIPNPHT